MRNLSVVAIFSAFPLGCSNHPPAPVPLSTGPEPKPAASVPASPPASTPARAFTQSPWSPGTRGMW